MIIEHYINTVSITDTLGRSDSTSTTQRTQSFSFVLPNKMHENPIYERSIYDIMIHHKDLRSLTENTSKNIPIYDEISLKSAQPHKKLSSNEKTLYESQYVEMSAMTPHYVSFPGEQKSHPLN